MNGLKVSSEILNELEQYPLVIFDMDETLVDLQTDWQGLKRELAQTTLAETGEKIQFSPLDIKLLEINNRYGQKLHQKLLDIISRYETQNEDRYVVNHKLIDFINKAPAEQTIAIFSANTRVAIDLVINKFLTRHPDIIISKENAIEPKPSGKDLSNLLETLGLEQKKAIYVGNSDYSDGESGKAAGIKTIIISI